MRDKIQVDLFVYSYALNRSRMADYLESVHTVKCLICNVGVQGLRSNENQGVY